MKRVFAALLAGLMTVSITACSNTDNVDKTDNSSQVSATESTVEASKTESEESTLTEITKTDKTQDDYLTDTKLYKCLFEKLQNDNVNIVVRGDIVSYNVLMPVIMIVQKQGDKLYVSRNVSDTKGMSFILKDGFAYTIDSIYGKYAKTTVEENTEIIDILDCISYITGTLEENEFIENGLSSKENTTDYEKYSSDTVTMTVYFNGDEIKYIDTVLKTVEETAENSEEIYPYEMEISITDEIDESLFEVSSDYEEVDSSELDDFSELLDRYTLDE